MRDENHANQQDDGARGSGSIGKKLTSIPKTTGFKITVLVIIALGIVIFTL